VTVAGYLAELLLVLRLEPLFSSLILTEFAVNSNFDNGVVESNTSLSVIFSDIDVRLRTVRLALK
jgi:hypothetical protein